MLDHLLYNKTMSDTLGCTLETSEIGVGFVLNSAAFSVVLKLEMNHSVFWEAAYSHTQFIRTVT